MELNLDNEIHKTKQNNFIENFIKELTKALGIYNKNDMNINVDHIEDIELTPEEDREFYKKECNFLKNYFKKELLDISNGEIFIVTSRYEADTENRRYKVTQYKDTSIRNYIAYENDLPSNVQLRDMVRKIDGKYIYDEQATQYVNNSINEIKQNIINKRD